MTAFLMELPNAVKLPGGGLAFVPDADDVATVVGGQAVSVMPRAYERFAMRRLFWREMGLRYDDMPRGEIEEAMLFRELERKHPQRFRQQPQQQQES